MDRRDEDLHLLLRARRARRGRTRRRGRTLALLSAFVVCAAAAVVGAAGAGGAQALLQTDCSLRSMRPIRLGANSFVYGAEGARLAAIPSTHNRQPVALPEISRSLRKATIAIEDRRFYQHGGLDYQGIVRAAIADVSAGRIVQGGSTIEQELARNLYLGSDQRTIPWKLEQACLATKIAARWSRAQILDMYLNQVYYGNHAYGVNAAAYTYFDRPASRLTVVQAALIAGLPQAPSLYDPFVHPTFARARRNAVLRALYQDGSLSRSAYRWAVSRPLGLHYGRIYDRVSDPTFVGDVVQQLDARFGKRAVAGGGLQIRTTLEARLQDAARRAEAGVLHTSGDPATALVAIDPATGAVRAMTAYQPGRPRLDFNLATQAHRQAGSAFKPFVLATALERGFSLDSTFAGPGSFVIPDPRCSTGVNQPWLVHNYGGETFGTIPLTTAIADSVNTVFAQLVDRVGPQHVVTVAHRMGISSPLQPVCSITLGTQPVTPLEMADAYATLADGGVHHAPQTVESVRGPRGRLLAQLQQQGEQAVPASVASQVSQALQGVIQHGTGTAAAIGRPAAGKTGTAEHEQDAWFCGYVPQLATCVWVGYPAGEIPMHNIEGVPAVVGGSLPAEIWHDFMTSALRGTPAKSLP